MPAALTFLSEDLGEGLEDLAQAEELQAQLLVHSPIASSDSLLHVLPFQPSCLGAGLPTSCILPILNTLSSPTTIASLEGMFNMARDSASANISSLNCREHT